MFRSIVILSAAVALASTPLIAQSPASPATSEPAGASESPDHPPSLHISRAHTEDWTTIDLAHSGLPSDPTMASSLGKTDLPGGCTREMVRLQWRPNDPIDLYIIRPSNMARPSLVLFQYNYTADDAIFREDRWCARATESGLALAGFSSALSWARMRPPRPLKEWFVSELQEALATSTHDVQMVLNYLQARGDLDVHRVGIFGQGSGGAIAILSAAADPRIAVLDLMDPWGDWPDWLQGSAQIPQEERATYLDPKFLSQVATLDPVEYLPRLRNRVIHIQQVLTDPVTPAAARDKIAQAASAPGELTRYPTRADEAKALGANGIIGWFGSELK